LDGLRKKQDKVLYENFELKNTIKTRQTSTLVQLEKYVIEDQSKVNFLKIEKGIKVLFIPFSPGVYVPFVLHQFSTEESETILKTEKASFFESLYGKNEKAIKNHFFLDLEALDENSQNVLNNFSLLVIGMIKYIKKKPCKSIKIEYMTGFEDEDMVLKNYA